MSYKSVQLFPPSSTHENNIRIAIRGPWSAPPAGLRDFQFLRSWLEYDSELDVGKRRGRINWGALLGLVVTAGISASFWTGVGLMVAHWWR